MTRLIYTFARESGLSFFSWVMKKNYHSAVNGRGIGGPSDGQRHSKSEYQGWARVPLSAAPGLPRPSLHYANDLIP